MVSRSIEDQILKRMKWRCHRCSSPRLSACVSGPSNDTPGDGTEMSDARGGALIPAGLLGWFMPV